MNSPTAKSSQFEAFRRILWLVMRWVMLFAAIAGLVALLVGILLASQRSNVLNSTYAALAAFIIGAVLIAAFARLWLQRIDEHRLLRSDEKLQNKDALVIATGSLLALHLGLCVVSAGAASLFPNRGLAGGFLALNTALAAVAVGGAFGFLLGHPRRLADGDAAKDGRTGSTWLLKTGLDDIVDWLVKGITTVLLVDARQLLTELKPLAQSLGNAFAGPAPDAVSASYGYSFALALIVYFTLFGTGATCLVTRTYLTGALGRADRSTVNAFSRAGLEWGEILTLVGAQRSLGSRSSDLTAEIRAVAEKLAALSLADLRTSREVALWAKAKSALDQPDDALKGYERAVLQCDCDPALLCDYAVALNKADQFDASIVRLDQARVGSSRVDLQACKLEYSIVSPK